MQIVVGAEAHPPAKNAGRGGATPNWEFHGKGWASPLFGDESKRAFWQERFYDFNVWTTKKRVEKLRYIHRNPVQRGLVERPEDWKWSSFRHYASGVLGTVEIESQWTARRRERMGIFPMVQTRPSKENPRPSRAWTGHPPE